MDIKIEWKGTPKMITEVAQIATSAPGVGDLQTIAPFAREFGLIAIGFFIMLLFNILMAAYGVETQ
jgi:hypothetical protein